MKDFSTGQIHADIAVATTLVGALTKAADIHGDNAALLSKDEDGEYTVRSSLKEFVEQITTELQTDINRESGGLTVKWEGSVPDKIFFDPRYLNQMINRSAL